MASTGQSSAAAGDRDGAHYRVGADTHQAHRLEQQRKISKNNILAGQTCHEKNSAAAGTSR